jgi:hypothetical protein
MSNILVSTGNVDVTSGDVGGKIWSSHNGGYKESYLPGYNALLVRWKSTDVSEEHVDFFFTVEE